MGKFAKKGTFSEAVCEKYIEPSDLEKEVAKLRAQGKSIATLNGSFDLMHAGHLEMIYQASLQADILIVALNTDASIQAYKSPLRPIVPLKYRLQMMAACAMVDYVTWFDETNPIELLKKIKPDVHVNGAEYGKDCIEAPTVNSFGGKVHIVNLVEGLSTTALLKKIAKTSSKWLTK